MKKLSTYLQIFRSHFYYQFFTDELFKLLSLDQFLCADEKHERTVGRSQHIRFERIGRDWKYTWAFPIQEKTALNEDYDKTKITGALIQGEKYPGCPYCGTKGFFCCSCGKLNCWNGKSHIATCNWCGATGELSDGIDSISITGNI